MVELAVALTIVVIASLGGFASQHASRGLTRISEETQAATSELQNAMNQLLVEAVDDLADPAGPYPEGQAIPAFNASALAAESIVPTYPNIIGGVIPDVLEIRLTITWQSFRGQTRTMSFSTCKAR